MVQTGSAAAAVTLVAYTPPANKCCLLELPAELRVQIYEHVLPSESSSTVIVNRSGISRRGGAKVSRKIIPTTLIFTCRPIKKEVTAMYVKSKTFKFKPGPSGWTTHDPIAPRTYRICPWWISDHIEAMECILLWTREDLYFKIDLSAGLTTNTLPLVNGDGQSVDLDYTDSTYHDFQFRMRRPTKHLAVADDNFRTTVHDFIANIVSKAREQNAEAVLNKENLRELLMLMDNVREEDRVTFRAWLSRPAKRWSNLSESYPPSLYPRFSSSSSTSTDVN